MIKVVLLGFDATFKVTTILFYSYYTIISIHSVILVDETGVLGNKPATCLKSLTKLITLACSKCTPPRLGNQLSTLVMIDTD